MELASDGSQSSVTEPNLLIQVVHRRHGIQLPAKEKREKKSWMRFVIWGKRRTEGRWDSLVERRTEAKRPPVLQYPGGVALLGTT